MQTKTQLTLGPGGETDFETEDMTRTWEIRERGTRRGEREQVRARNRVPTFKYSPPFSSPGFIFLHLWVSLALILFSPYEI